MKAMTIPRHGGPEVLTYVEDYPEPEVPRDHVLVKVEASGVNRMDFLVRAGYPGLELPLPHVCGGDIAGTVVKVGKEVTDVSEGERVVVHPLVSCGHCAPCREGRPNLCANWKSIGIHLSGGYAEYAAVPGKNIVPLPPEVSFEHAAALPVAGLTAYHAIHTVGKVRSGQTLFLWGGSGTVGTLAVQIAKEAGARVISTAGSAERAAVVRSIGAEECIDRSSEDVGARMKELAPEGVHLVLDYIGAATFEKSFSFLQNGGKLLIFGIMTGKEVGLNLHQTYFHHRSIDGLFLGTMDDLRGVLDLVARKRVQPVIDSIVPLAQAADAQRKVAEGKHEGKIVLIP